MEIERVNDTTIRFFLLRIKISKSVGLNVKRSGTIVREAKNFFLRHDE